MTNLDSAFKRLRAATEAHKEASMKNDAARSALCNAINELNSAQKEFDAAIADIKDSAPRDSDWTMNKNKPIFPKVAA